jgi:signal peptidase I
MRQLLRWTERFLAVVGLCFIVWHLCFELLVMTSDSMAPTLRGSSYENGDRIVVEKVTRHIRSPRRWEIYFFYNSEGVPVAKRIVGLPGERISVKQNQIWINGQEVARPAELKGLEYYADGNLHADREVDCGEGFFVMGDDSRDSWDSRYLGPVTAEQFQGRVWCVVWPFSRLGFVR